MRNRHVFLLFLMVACISSIGLAEESAAYSLGTMQPTNVYVASPGKNLTVEFYIFNAYGNRVSHITLAVGNNPANLQVELPPLQKNNWNISGIITPIEEHLYIDPMPIVEVKPDNPPEGIYYLKSTNVTGYIPAKKVQATVKMPADAELGGTYSFTIMALAQWYGDLGTAQVSQSRPFPFKIRVVTENYSETLYNPPEEGGGGWNLGLSNEMIFGIVIAVLVMVVLFQQFRPKKHR